MKTGISSVSCSGSRWSIPDLVIVDMGGDVSVDWSWLPVNHWLTSRSYIVGMFIYSEQYLVRSWECPGQFEGSVSVTQYQAFLFFSPACQMWVIDDATSSDGQTKHDRGGYVGGNTVPLSLVWWLRWNVGSHSRDMESVEQFKKFKILETHRFKQLFFFFVISGVLESNFQHDIAVPLPFKLIRQTS